MQSNPAYQEDEQRWCALMASAQSGNAGDYRCLLAEIAVVLERYFTRRIGGGSYVDDCVQDVLLAVHEARHTYDPAQPFRPWLFAIARHKAVDNIRREARSGGCELPPDVEDSSQHGAVVEERVASGRMLDALATQYREPIMLTKIIGLSTSEAAARLDISESAVKVRVHRGIRRLRQMLESETP